jgi:glutaredoxin 3
MSKVEIYTTQWCPYCHAAKSLLDRTGVDYDEIDAQDRETRAAMIQRAHGRRTVPQIFVGDRHLGGYDEIAALERAGRLDQTLKN